MHISRVILYEWIFMKLAVNDHQQYVYLLPGPDLNSL